MRKTRECLKYVRFQVRVSLKFNDGHTSTIAYNPRLFWTITAFVLLI